MEGIKRLAVLRDLKPNVLNTAGLKTEMFDLNSYLAWDAKSSVNKTKYVNNDVSKIDPWVDQNREG